MKQQIVGNTLEIARHVAEAHGLLANHHNGTFGQWVKERCGFSQMTANRLIRVHQNFGDCNTVLQTFDASALYYLVRDDVPAATMPAIGLSTTSLAGGT